MQTMLPLLGGAAIYAGSVAFLPDGVTREQRGFPRVGAGDRRRFPCSTNRWRARVVAAGARSPRRLAGDVRHSPPEIRDA
jgi:hypothetical protein